MRAELLRQFVWMAVLFIAMAFLESAVVVYLRALYYPSGFDFPLVVMDRALWTTEIGREMATLILLFAPGALLTRRALERFAWFCFGFGVWDIFYYVWLKALLDWPTSLVTADLLFLVPIPWIGPVWCPIVVSFGLIAWAVIVLRARAQHPCCHLPRVGGGLLGAGAMVMVLSFLIEPWHAVREHIGADLRLLDGEHVLEAMRFFQPTGFPLGLFLAGAAISTIGLLWTAVRMH